METIERRINPIKCVGGIKKVKLTEVSVRTFRNFVDSGAVKIESGITCLVGKNESGKSAFLQAIARLNPVQGGSPPTITFDYPAWLEKRDRQRGEDLNTATFVSGSFYLSDDELTPIAEEFGSKTLSPEVVIVRSYDNCIRYRLIVDETAFVRHVVKSVTWPRGTKTEANRKNSIAELDEYVQAIPDNDDSDRREELAQLEGALEAKLGPVRQAGLVATIWERIRHRLPTFLYFSDYETLPYSVPVRRILEAAPESLNGSERTARSFLEMAAAADEYLTNPDYELRKRELENVANALTDDVLKYWSQNPELRVTPDITMTTQTDPRGQQSVVHELKVRIWDNRHQLSLPFDRHSAGFQWFFSFLVAFSRYRFTDEPLVILLDEPATGLHGRAQADYLKFINEVLAPRAQVVYTTHSPFMVEPGQLDRVRIVEDHGREGAVVTQDFALLQHDTLFPLQGALGYDLVQNLFIAPNNLVVEGTSDYTYLRVLSDYLRSLGRQSLDDRWSIVPVGGVDLVPTFVALLGNHLDLTVLVDAKKDGHQKLAQLAREGILDSTRILTIGMIIHQPAADIEDLFDVDDYLAFYNAAFAQSLTQADLVGAGPLVQRIARFLNVSRFDHGQPADELLRHRDRFLPSLTSVTLDNFERLITAVNATLPPPQ